MQITELMLAQDSVTLVKILKKYSVLDKFCINLNNNDKS